MGFGISKDKSTVINAALTSMETSQNYSLNLSKPHLTQVESTLEMKESIIYAKIE